MQIEKDMVVSFHYRLQEVIDDVAGEELESSRDGQPALYMHGHGGIIKGLEQAFAGKSSGDQFVVTLKPEQAYGVRQEDAEQRVPSKHLMADKKTRLKPGMVVNVNTDKGQRQVTILKVGKFSVDVDSNHPLAGKTLSFEVEVVDVRQATAEELSHGHAHGVGGHQH